MLNLTQIKRILQAIGLLILLMAGNGLALAAERPGDFFYQQEPAGTSSQQSCSALFGAILSGQQADAGGIVKNLRYINIHFLLEDYDNSQSPDPRKNKHFKVDQLLREIATAKREIYCRVELALYMKGKEKYKGPVYDQLLTKALEVIEKTYASAEQSSSLKNYQRAKFAFDLIAPYKDSYQKYLAADRQLQAAAGESSESPSAGPEQRKVAGEDSQPGHIELAALANPLDAPAEVVPKAPGVIAQAARPGAVALALNLLQQDSPAERSE